MRAKPFLLRCILVTLLLLPIGPVRIALAAAPSISSISNQTTDEDTPTAAIDFIISDAETAPADLTVTASSSNTTLVPNGNIATVCTPDVSVSNCKVTVNPASNEFGTTDITLTVQDTEPSTSSTTFTLTVNSINDVPTISNIDNQTINEDNSLNGLGFTVSDVETAAGDLSLSKNSSNLTLVPLDNIVFGGSGANRTVTISPAANQSGSATITITVSDSTDSASDQFTLIVNAVNDAPTISDIPNQVVNEDTSTGAISFTVGDAETPIGSLEVTANSSNLTLVPITNIVLGGSGASRTVTVSPAANLSGTATITVNVSDGNTTASDQFTLTVNAVNDAPTITDIPNQSVNEDASTGALSFTIGDAETPAASLTVTVDSSNLTLVPLANIALGGSGASRTVTVTPASEQSGTATITINVSDGTTTVSDSFLLNVTAVLDAPTITDIPNQTVNEDISTGTLSFSIGDADTPIDSLSLSKNSSNLALVPLNNIVLGGTGTSRTVTVNPALDQNGAATITISVSDGTTTVSDTFILNVAAINDAPTNITLSDPNVDENQLVGTVVGTLSATDVDNSSFTFSLVPGTGDTNNTSFEIAGNALKTNAIFDRETQSSYSIRVRATDAGGLSFDKQFTITITNVNEAPTALNDPYTVRQGSTLTVTETLGFLANDKDVDENANLKGYEYLTGEVVTGPQHAVSFNLIEGTGGKFRGGFVYRPEPHFAGIDTFTYRAKDKEGAFSVEATVEITILDIESPQVSWTSPVTDGVTYDVTTGIITLTVNAEDNVSISRVRFLRWDAVQNKHIEIGMDYDAPYQVQLDTNVLNWGWNQIFAEAYDNLNNRSNIPYIWLYKNKIPTFLPILIVPPRSG